MQTKPSMNKIPSNRRKRLIPFMIMPVALEDLGRNVINIASAVGSPMNISALCSFCPRTSTR